MSATIDQLGLDFHASQRAAQAGMTSALPPRDDPWAMSFERAVCRLASTGREFSADDVFQMVGAPSDERRAKAAPGALMNRMAKLGVIRHVGYTKSARPQSHNNLLRTWVGV